MVFLNIHWHGLNDLLHKNNFKKIFIGLIWFCRLLFLEKIWVITVRKGLIFGEF